MNFHLLATLSPAMRSLLFCCTAIRVWERQNLKSGFTIIGLIIVIGVVANCLQIWTVGGASVNERKLINLDPSSETGINYRNPRYVTALVTVLVSPKTLKPMCSFVSDWENVTNLTVRLLAQILAQLINSGKRTDLSLTTPLASPAESKNVMIGFQHLCFVWILCINHWSDGSGRTGRVSRPWGWQ